MSCSEFRQRADRLRAVPLEAVLQAWGAQRDPDDPHKWHTSQGVLSVTGAKFMNWNRGRGGGGAIDLAIHLTHRSFVAALQWLEAHFADRVSSSPGSHRARPTSSHPFPTRANSGGSNTT